MSNAVRRSVLSLVLTAALALAFAALAPSAVRAGDGPEIHTRKSGILQVCLYAGFAPFASKDEDGDWQGWDYDYLQGFAAAHHLELEVVEKDFDGIWKQPGLDQCDVAGTGISDTSQRRGDTRGTGCWSATYYHVLRSFLVRTPDYARLQEVAGLQGRTVVVTKGSTAHLDVCNRMQDAHLQPCKKADGDHPCPALQESQEAATCVRITYPRCDDEANAAADVAAKKDDSFAYGGGFGSVQTQVCRVKGLTVVWPHCNMTNVGGTTNKPYAEPFSFVVRQADDGLLAALNLYIANAGKAHKSYKGTPIPDLGCVEPPWTADPQPGCEP